MRQKRAFNRMRVLCSAVGPGGSVGSVYDGRRALSIGNAGSAVRCRRRAHLIVGLKPLRQAPLAGDLVLHPLRPSAATGTFRPVLTADGTGIASHAGAALLGELADQSGLTQGWTAALLDTYKGTPVHLPGRVTDLAVTLADGGDCLADLAALRDQAALFGPVASHPTSYRVLDRVGAGATPPGW